MLKSIKNKVSRLNQIRELQNKRNTMNMDRLCEATILSKIEEARFLIPYLIANIFFSDKHVVRFFIDTYIQTGT